MTISIIGKPNHNIAGYLRVGHGSFGVPVTLALNSAYTYNSAGNCIFYRFVAPVTGTLDEVHFYIATTKTGTPGDLKVEVRNFNTSSTQPGSTLLGSGTVTPSGTLPCWQKVTLSSPVSVTQGTAYYLVIAPSGTADGSNYFTVLCVGGPTSSYATHTRGFNSYTSANGGNTGTQQGGNGSGTYVCKFTVSGSAFYWGNPYTVSDNTINTNNTQPRGMKIENLPGPITVVAACHGFLTRAGTWKIFEGSAPNPAGTPLSSIAIPTDNQAQNAASVSVFTTPVVMYPGKTYRVVYVPTSNDPEPYGCHIVNANGYTTALQACRMFGGRICQTKYTGSVWTDYPDTMPSFELMLGDTLPGAIGAHPAMGY